MIPIHLYTDVSTHKEKYLPTESKGENAECGQLRRLTKLVQGNNGDQQSHEVAGHDDENQRFCQILEINVHSQHHDAGQTKEFFNAGRFNLAIEFCKPFLMTLFEYAVAVSDAEDVERRESNTDCKLELG